VAATVLGRPVHARDAEELRKAVLKPLADRFVAARGITVTADEIAAFERDRDATLRRHGVVPEALGSAEEKAVSARISAAFILHWKTNRALYQHYGGRLGSQQGGPEALDGWRALAEDAQARGELRFHDRALEDAFWRYFGSDTMHRLYTPADASRVFERPPWDAAP